jgi:ABC-type glycerol-3-phosphate transport system substrate-binding protein
MPEEVLRVYIRRNTVKLRTCCFLLILGASILFSGCFDNIKMPAEFDDTRTTIRFWHSMAGGLGEVLDELIIRFQKENPDIRVISIYQGSYGSLSQKIIGAAVVNELPDISQAYPAWISRLNEDPENQAVIALDDRIAADKDFDVDDLVSVLLDDCKMDGKLYAIPFNKSFPVLYYNKEMLDRYNLKPPVTWDEFTDVARALTKDLDSDGQIDQWGWAFNNDSMIFECAILQHGGKLIAKDGLSVPFDEQPTLDALYVFMDAAFGKNPYAYPVTGYDHQTDFVTQKVGLMQTSSVSREFMEKQLRFDYGMAPLPSGKNRAAILSGTNLCMFKTNDEERQSAAWRFLKFFTSTESTAYWSINTSYVPVRHSAVSSMKDYLKKDPNSAAAIDQIDVASFEPVFPAWFECRQILKNYFQKITTEVGADMPPTEAEVKASLSVYLKRMTKEINNKLETRDIR